MQLFCQDYLSNVWPLWSLSLGLILAGLLCFGFDRYSLLMIWIKPENGVGFFTFNSFKFSFQGWRSLRNLYTVGFRWKKHAVKYFTTYFMGSSPEFNMAIYSAVFLTTKAKFPAHVRLGMSLKHANSRIVFACFKADGNAIGSCYVL